MTSVITRNLVITLSNIRSPNDVISYQTFVIVFSHLAREY